MATGETSTLMALRDPDIRLMLRVRADDRAAFAEIVTAYQHRLVAVLHHVVGRRDEAEDLAQEVFLRVYQSRARYTPRAKFSTWLFTIANNLAASGTRPYRWSRATPPPAAPCRRTTPATTATRRRPTTSTRKNSPRPSAGRSTACRSGSGWRSC
jgi:DNA-directed RNA polymerase specialized sigma24 family protein